MSEISRDMNTSSEMNTGPDLFQYYIRSVSELLAGDGFLQSSSKNACSVGVGNGSFKGKDVPKEKNGPVVGSGSLFCNAIGNGLSGHEKTRLRTILNQSVIALNREVDEMLHPVITMRRLRALMVPTKKCATNQDANGKVDVEIRARKRLKVSSPSSLLIEEVSANEGLGVTETGKSLPRCKNNRCVKSKPKSDPDESKSLCGDSSKQVNSGSFLGSSSRADKENGEVNDDLQVLLVNRGPVVEKMEKHSAELSVMLSRMEDKLEELLNTVISSCREMTLAEKHQLRRLIENLPPQNLDRVVNILQREKPPEKQSNHNDITVDLLKEKDLMLWRIYFYVKAVESAQKLVE